MSRSLFFARLLLIIILSSCSSTAKNILSTTITAKVIAVIDGDTIDILYDGKPVRIRLAHIDCPEIRKGQPFNKAAKQLASALCFGQEVQVLNNGEFDRWGRLVAVIINNKDQNINKEMLRAGLAWHYKRYSTDSSYANIEMKARQNRMGLWAHEKPVPPWEWREQKPKKVLKESNTGEVIAH
jgi:endonuclease YncB( thermonuclease family)